MHLYSFSTIPLDTVRGVMLDLDNTLYEYSPCHSAGLSAAFQVYKTKRNIDFDSFMVLYKEAQIHVKISTKGQAASHSRILYFQHMLEKTEKSTNVHDTLLLEEVYWNSFMKTMTLKEEALHFLIECKKRGIMVCIITDLTIQIQLRKIEQLEIEEYTQYIVSSEEAGVEKPDQGIFMYALAKMGIPSNDVIVVGDDEKKDIDGARRCNIPAYQVI